MNLSLVLRFYFKAFIFVVFILPNLVFATASGSFVVSGQIVKPDGLTLESPAVTFTVQLKSTAAGSCVLWAENFNVQDMTGLDGHFSLVLGSGTRTDGGTHNLSDIFANSKSFATSTACSGGYVPAAGDERSMTLTFSDNGGAVQTLASQNIKAIPKASAIGDYGVANLAKISGAGSTSVLTPSMFDFLANLSVAGISGGAPCASGEILKFNGTNWACAADATGGASAGNASYTALGLVQFNTNAATSGINVTSGLASVNSGTGANQIVKLDASAKLPAVDGSLLSGLSAGNITSGTMSIARGGTNSTTALNNNRILVSNAGAIVESGALANGQLLIGSTGAAPVVASLIAGSGIAITPGAGSITISATGGGGAVTSVTGAGAISASAGLTPVISIADGSYGVKGALGVLTDAGSSGLIVSSGIVSVNSGSTANKVVKLDASAKLPPVDGSALTGLSASNISAGVLSVSNGGTGSNGFLGNTLLATNGTGSFIQSYSCVSGQVLGFGATGSIGCENTNGAGQLIRLDGSTNLTLPSALVQTGVSSPSVSVAGSGKIYFDLTANKFKVSQNGAAYVDLIGPPGGVSSVSGVGAISSTGGGTPSISIVDSGYGVKGAVSFAADAGTSGISITAGVASVNSGTGANQIVKLDTSAKLPAVDGSLLTNLNLANFGTPLMPISRGGTNSATALTNGKVMVSSSGSILEGGAFSTTNVANTFVVRDGSGGIGANLGSFSQVNISAGGSLFLNGSTSGQVSVSSPAAPTSYNLILPSTAGTANQILTTNGSGVSNWSSGFLQGGNSFGATASFGTNDAFGLNIKVGGASALSIDSVGNVGIGQTAPVKKLDVNGDALINGVSIGAGAGTNNLMFGQSAFNLTSTGTFNTAIGFNALSSLTSGGTNLGVGKNAGSMITSGFGNVVIGSNTGASIATSNYNVIISDGLGNIKTQFDISGNMSLGGALQTGKANIKQAVLGSAALDFQDGSSNSLAKFVNPSNGGSNSWNSTAAVLYVGKDSTSLRSINAAGTVNVSGADFAEWVDWEGPQPEMGSVIHYRGIYAVVSSPAMAAFVGNESRRKSSSILLAFAGQLPVRVRGQVRVGDLIVAHDDGTAYSVNKAHATNIEVAKGVGTAWASSDNSGLKAVNVAVGINHFANAGIVSRDPAAVNDQIKKLNDENQRLQGQVLEMKARLERLEKIIEAR